MTPPMKLMGQVAPVAVDPILWLLFDRFVG